MSEVKRYEIGGPDWEMDESPIGEWVSWDDYAALEAQCERLRASLKDADSALVHYIERSKELSAYLDEIRRQSPVGYTTAGFLAIAKELPLTGRIGARTKSDERWNVPIYAAPAATQDQPWLSYTDPEASQEENTVRSVSSLVAGKAFNDICRMLGGRWPDAKLEQEAPEAYKFFMALIGAKPTA